MAPYDAGPRRARTGIHLRTSIGSSVRLTSPTQVLGRVGSPLPHALVAHEGARPHIITRGAKKLRFIWPEKDNPTPREVRQGMLVFFNQVNHPGMRGVKYLTIPLAAIGRARGYRVSLVQRPS